MTAAEKIRERIDTLNKAMDAIATLTEEGSRHSTWDHMLWERVGLEWALKVVDVESPGKEIGVCADCGEEDKLIPRKICPECWRAVCEGCYGVEACSECEEVEG